MMELGDWITILQIAVAILLPGVGFLAASTIGNSKAIARLQGEFDAFKSFLESSMKDIKDRLRSIDDHIRQSKGGS